MSSEDTTEEQEDEPWTGTCPTCQQDNHEPMLAKLRALVTQFYEESEKANDNARKYDDHRADASYAEMQTLSYAADQLTRILDETQE